MITTITYRRRKPASRNDTAGHVFSSSVSSHETGRHFPCEPGRYIALGKCINGYLCIDLVIFADPTSVSDKTVAISASLISLGATLVFHSFIYSHPSAAQHQHQAAFPSVIHIYFQDRSAPDRTPAETSLAVDRTRTLLDRDPTSGGRVCSAPSAAVSVGVLLTDSQLWNSTSTPFYITYTVQEYLLTSRTVSSFLSFISYCASTGLVTRPNHHLRHNFRT